MSKKNGLLYFLGILLLLGMLFMYETQSTKKFVWESTYHRFDKHPFGSYVFDDVVSSSIPNYQVIHQTFYQIYEESLPYDFETSTNSENQSYGLTDDVLADETLTDETLVDEALTDEELQEALLNDSTYNPDTAVEKIWEQPPLPPDKRNAYLITQETLPFGQTDWTALKQLLQQGHAVMLCIESFPTLLKDSLSFSLAYNSSYSHHTLQTYVKEGYQRDSLILEAHKGLPEAVYHVYPQLCPVYFDRSDQAAQSGTKSELDTATLNMLCDSLVVLAKNESGQPVAVQLFLGAGELFLVSTPLLFTNYGMLDNNNASYAFRLLACLKDKPLYRIESYGMTNEAKTPLRYLLTQPPLLWAFVFALMTLILCMIFTAKRKQRVIPVTRPPANETLRFTQLIGNLYYQKKDYKDLLRMKYLYFCMDAKRLNGIDLQTDKPDEIQSRHLAEKMGKEPELVWPAFRKLKFLLRTDSTLNEKDMIDSVNQLNAWRKLLN